MASLKERILAEIDREGPMTVARFMQQALYDAEEGYYMRPQRRAGREWVTGPTLSPIFGHTLASLVAAAIDGMQTPQLVEAGTGGGELTRDLAYGLHQQAEQAFDRLELVPVDASPSARKRARQTLQQAGILLEDVTIASSLPDAISGVLVANELVDALPTHVCQHTDRGLAEIHLERGEPTLAPSLAGPSDPAILRLAERFAEQLEPGVRFEAPLEAFEWYRQAADRLVEGAIVIVDYGHRRRKLLQAYPKGTIHAYRQGRRIEEFWYDPGQMDITYRVPFDEIARIGEEQGLQTLAYGSQGAILEALGIREIASQAGSQAALATKKLIDPQGAGGTFRILVQARGIDRDEGLEDPLESLPNDLERG